MERKKFFSIDGLTTVVHTPETEKIWQSWDGCKSDKGRKAVLNYAIAMGFETVEVNECKLEIVKEAFDYLVAQFPDISGVKSFVLRTAIINYS